jgi:solute carrier family 35 protein F5
VFKISAVFALFWFLSNYLYNYGLSCSSITSSTILSNTSPTWVYLISISCLLSEQQRQQFKISKALFVVISLSGFIVIAMQDQAESENNLIGDVLTVLSAIFYSLYATFLKIKVPPEDEEKFKFSWFLGFVGLINDVIILPFFFIFNWTGIEPFEWPNRETFVLLTVNALFGTVVSDYCWARSVVLLGPLVTVLGITLTFPISLTIDLLSNDQTFTWQYFVGSALIFTAFGGIVLIDYLDEKKKLKQKEQLTSRVQFSDTSLTEGDTGEPSPLMVDNSETILFD